MEGPPKDQLALVCRSMQVNNACTNFEIWVPASLPRVCFWSLLGVILTFTCILCLFLKIKAIIKHEGLVGICLDLPVQQEMQWFSMELKLCLSFTACLALCTNSFKRPHSQQYHSMVKLVSTIVQWLVESPQVLHILRLHTLLQAQKLTAQHPWNAACLAKLNMEWAILRNSSIPEHCTG